MPLLMNATLVKKVNWAKVAPNSPSRFAKGKTWRESAMDDLISYLLREGFKDTAATKLGKDYEDMVVEYARSGKLEGLGEPLTHKQAVTLNKIADVIRGHNTQVYHETMVELRGKNYRLYGLLDFEADTAITDLKTTSNYKSNAYDSNEQDIFYRYTVLHDEKHSNPDAAVKSFTYLVGIIGEERGVIDRWPSTLIIRALPAAKPQLLEVMTHTYIEDTVAQLKTFDLLDLYEQCYCHKGFGYARELPDAVKIELYNEWRARFKRPLIDIGSDVGEDRVKL